MDDWRFKRRPGIIPSSFWPMSVGSTPFSEKEAKMEKKRKATAKALVGLVNDLTDEQLLALTDSANRPALREFIHATLMLPIVKFVVADHFNMTLDDSVSANALVKLDYPSHNFRSWFLPKIEKMRSVAVPRFHHDLNKYSTDEEIIVSLGGEIKAEVTLAGIYELMKAQREGRSGVLSIKDCGNIFYVRDVNKILRVVQMTWYGGGWKLRAFNKSSWDGFPFRIFSN